MVMILLLLFALLFGACVGSFLNVVILRLPADESLWRRASHCMACNAPVRVYDNIPVLSYLILRGRCRACGARFSPQYLIVEAVTAIVFAATFWHRCAPLATSFDTGVMPSWQALWACAAPWLADISLFSILLAMTVIDARHYIIPLELSVSGFLTGACLSLLYPQLRGVDTVWLAFSEMGKALIAGAGLMLTVRTLGGWWFKREALGMGDVHLMAMLAMYMNWPSVLLVIFFSALLGSIGGITAKIVQRRSHWRFEIPYGPYIAAGALVVHWFGTPLIEWYLSFVAL